MGNKTCPVCNGKGTCYGYIDIFTNSEMGEVECHQCGGTGVYFEPEKCSTCGGTGTVTPKCPVCGGTGTKPGKQHPKGAYDNEVYCDNCDGQGYVYDNCPDCDGSGWIKE